jgi:hypothetical protein
MAPAPVYRRCERAAAQVLLAAALSCGTIGCGSAPSPSEACKPRVFDRGRGWLEVGGPTVFLHHDPPYHAPVRARMAWVRVAVPTRGRPVIVELHRLDGEGRSEGLIQPDVVPAEAFEFPPPHLPGEIHFAMLDFPAAGCWQLDVSVDGEVAGRALIQVERLPAASGRRALASNASRAQSPA